MALCGGLVFDTTNIVNETKELKGKSENARNIADQSLSNETY